jgi:hypothetical protein
MEKNKLTKLTDHMDGFYKKKINYENYEISFRRWLVSQVDSGVMGLEEARDRFQLSGLEYKRIISRWQERYSEELHLSLSFMTSKERADHKELEKRIKELENQLEQAKMKNIALETLIDVAETELKIPIRKKSGPKQ